MEKASYTRRGQTNAQMAKIQMTRAKMAGALTIALAFNTTAATDAGAVGAYAPLSPATPHAGTTHATSPFMGPVIDFDAITRDLKSQNLASQLQIAAQVVTLRQTNDPRYTPATDPQIIDMLKRIRALVRDDSADPNFKPKTDIQTGIQIGAHTKLNAFQAAVHLSIMTQTDLLVRDFARHGADMHVMDENEMSVMDHAIVNFVAAQERTMSQTKSALNLITSLRDMGLPISAASYIFSGEEGSLLWLAENMGSLNALYEYGLITLQEREQIITGTHGSQDSMKNADRITPTMLTHYGSRMNKYTSIPPGKNLAYTTVDGDTLHGVSGHFMHLITAPDIDAAREKLATHNNITDTQEQPLPKGTVISIPINPLFEIRISRATGDTSIADMADTLKDFYYRDGLTPTERAIDFAVFNGYDPDHVLKQGDLLMSPVKRNLQTMPPAITPTGERNDRLVDVIVVEENKANDSTHSRQTYRVATETAYVVNPHVDMNRFHSMNETLISFPSYATSDGLRMVINTHSTPLHGRIVFSHSMEWALESGIERAMDTRRNRHGKDHMLYHSTIGILPHIELNKPIVFNAAGNSWDKGGGRYITSHATTHSPRSVIVGSAGFYASQNDTTASQITFALYSGYSADICAKQPTNIGVQMEGTSFSTPHMAALYRQMDAWYGDRLSFEEIMAAALMSADRVANDFENPGRHSPPKKHTELNTALATYQSNGGGIPHHERCGAGIVNAQKWHDAIQKILPKRPSSARDNYMSHTLKIGAPHTTRTVDEKTEHIYSVTIPATMTMGKMTFIVPQEKRSYGDIVVRTPAGFEMRLPKSHTDIVSTFAFAYEDAARGTKLQIRTTGKLDPDAAIIIRGHAPGNRIASLRDQLKKAGALPPPLKLIHGDTVIGAAKKVDIHTPPPPAPRPIPQS